MPLPLFGSIESPSLQITALAGIYLHIPFCKQACYYCDFHFSTNLRLREDLVQAMIKETDLRKDYLQGQSVRTIYLGGGTPSLLTSGQLQTILDKVYQTFSVHPEAEVTLEANPDDLSHDTLSTLWSLGVNRLSIGIQSFDDKILRWMNRAHSGPEAISAVTNAHKVGFENLSLDLIYGVPNSSPSRLEKDLAQLLQLNPVHISAYSLTIEPNTVFGRRQQKGKLNAADDVEVVQEYNYITQNLRLAGFDHYEVSNFGKPGFYSQHNTSYWHQIPYLGLGPSAHSYNGFSRSYSIANNAKYIKTIRQGILPMEQEDLSEKDQLNEYVLTRIRTQWGIDMEKIQNNFNIDFRRKYTTVFTRWIEEGLAFWREGHFILTENGLLLADSLAEELFLE